MIPIYFYAPNPHDFEMLLMDHSQWSGHHSNFTPWIAQTYFHLKQAGFPCAVTDKIPDQGILIAHWEAFADQYPLCDQVMLICVRSDQDYHPSAHLHILHNPQMFAKDQSSIWNPILIDHWPMPGIIPRATERQQLIERISYVGDRSQLASELKSETWKNELQKLNCQWLPMWEQSQWNNYEKIDVIVAARSFDHRVYPTKGAIKLINAWHASVPAILTPEIGFMDKRKSDLDFLIIRSPEEALQAIQYLQNHPDFYQKMVDNGLERAKEHSTERVLAQWLNFLENVACPAYEKWVKMSLTEKKWLFRQRFFYFKVDRLKDKIYRWTKWEL